MIFFLKKRQLIIKLSYFQRVQDLQVSDDTLETPGYIQNTVVILIGLRRGRSITCVFQFVVPLPELLPGLGHLALLYLKIKKTYVNMTFAISKLKCQKNI